MNVTIDQYSSLVHKFDTASWALWSNGFNKLGCVESDPNAIEGFLREHIAELRGDVVLLGLNRSLKRRGSSHYGADNYPRCVNFHSKGHVGDGLLCATVSQLVNIRGAFMTDLSNEQESDSSKVELDHPRAIDHLMQQLTILGSQETHIVCFGWKAFNVFQSMSSAPPDEIPASDRVLKLEVVCNEQALHCYKVIHYSYAARYGHQLRFKRQMEAVNQTIMNGITTSPHNHPEERS